VIWSGATIPALAPPSIDRTAEFDNSSSTSRSTNLSNDVQDDVLTAYARHELSLDLNLHVLTPLCDKSLCGQNVLNFARADSERESTEGAMCRCVAVTTDNCGSGQRKALFGSDDVHDTLPLVVETKVCEIECLDVVLEGHALCSRVGLVDKLLSCGEVFP
jgi:hypothetical protein